MWSRDFLERQCHDLKPGSQNALCDLLARSSNSIHPASQKHVIVSNYFSFQAITNSKEDIKHTPLNSEHYLKAEVSSKRRQKTQFKNPKAPVNVSNDQFLAFKII